MSGFPTATYLPMVDGSQWLEQRRHGIGGSDASVIMGFNRYASTLDLWEQKRSTEPLAYDPPSEAAQWGHRLEPLVADRLEQAIQSEVDEQLWLKPPDACLQNTERPYMLANLDRIVLSDDNGGLVPVGIAEVKTVGLRMAGEWGDEGVAMHALWQGIHYMAVTGLPVIYFGALVGGQEFRFRTVRRDEVTDLEEQLLDAEEEFWKHVQDGTEPPLVGFSDANMASLSRRYPMADPDTYTEVDPDVAEAVQMYRAAAESERAAKAIKDQCKQTVHEALGSAEAATYGGEVIATYKHTIRKTIDTTALKKDMPEVAEKYLKSSTSRTLRVV